MLVTCPVEFGSCSLQSNVHVFSGFDAVGLLFNFRVTIMKAAARMPLEPYTLRLFFAHFAGFPDNTTLDLR
jgi:hypothetical protein